jgi:hypothetical protein
VVTVADPAAFAVERAYSFGRPRLLAAHELSLTADPPASPVLIAFVGRHGEPVFAIRLDTYLDEEKPEARGNQHGE